MFASVFTWFHAKYTLFFAFHGTFRVRALSITFLVTAWTVLRARAFAEMSTHLSSVTLLFTVSMEKVKLAFSALRWTLMTTF